MSENIKVLSPEGVVGIESCNDLRVQLLQAFDTADPVLLNFAHIERIDLSFVQLLYAGVREARIRGIGFRFNGEVSKEVGEYLVTGGFCKEVPAQARELENNLVELQDK
ncbi:MAG: STAS domain-containing protein [Spirochaetaceae bacterium]|nr:MAG: STAS domain-containing protein [Spirochaetaceae bacterium]